MTRRVKLVHGFSIQTFFEKDHLRINYYIGSDISSINIGYLSIEDKFLSYRFNTKYKQEVVMSNQGWFNDKGALGTEFNCGLLKAIDFGVDDYIKFDELLVGFSNRGSVI